MNHYELLSVGFNTGILSDKVYSSFYRTRFVKDWEAAQADIQSKRREEQNTKIFAEFETVALRWGGKKN